MTRPFALAEILRVDPEELREITEQAGHLLARVVLLRIAVRRLPGGRELTESRLGRLASSLQEAVEDGRAALRSLQDEIAQGGKA